MKKLLTVALGVVMLMAFADLGVAQQKGVVKSPLMGGEMKPPTPEKKKMDKASPQLMQAKVLEVNESTKTVTVMANGKTFTLDAKNLKSLPKPGEIVSMWGDPTGPPTNQRLVCHSCNCPPPGAAGPCNLCCFDYQPL